MSPLLLTLYVLMWPVVVAGTLAVICRAFVQEAVRARRQGRRLI